MATLLIKSNSKFSSIRRNGRSVGLHSRLLSLVIHTIKASSVSNDPVLHFVLFVPSLARRPLYIQDEQGSPSHTHFLPDVLD